MIVAQLCKRWSKSPKSAGFSTISTRLWRSYQPSTIPRFSDWRKRRQLFLHKRCKIALRELLFVCRVRRRSLVWSALASSLELTTDRCSFSFVVRFQIIHGWPWRSCGQSLQRLPGSIEDVQSTLHSLHRDLHVSIPSFSWFCCSPKMRLSFQSTEHNQTGKKRVFCDWSLYLRALLNLFPNFCFSFQDGSYVYRRKSIDCVWPDQLQEMPVDGPNNEGHRALSASPVRSRS